MLSRSGWSETPPSIRFNSDVRPILAENCFHCHGPDSATREADLRLDLESGLFSARKAGRVVERGNPGSSLLIQRIKSTDPEAVMPPPGSGKRLTSEQRKTLIDWVRQGAAWEGHWAFQPIRRPVIPIATADQHESANPIDRFVRRQLKQQQLSPSREAPAETLVRRVFLDLTGLPPTPANIDRFLNDPGSDRYERLVDTLLASPRYGEHMAVAWLDAARYSDTSGYQTDGTRVMWRWRDWLIQALNAGMPYDELTIEMLAGDLLPNPTLDQQIATGFQRNHRGNSEGGSIADEFLVEYVVDRVDTMGTVWLGMTLGCARCHDHKYDPISQRDYYRMFAFFNNIPESGRALKLGNSPPYIKAPTTDQSQRWKELDRQLSELERRWSDSAEGRRDAQQQWETSTSPQSLSNADHWHLSRDLVAAYPLENSFAPIDARLPGPASVGKTARLISEPRACIELDGESFLDAGDVGHFGYLDGFTVAAWIKPEGSLSGGIVTRMSDDFDSPGWAMQLEKGKLQANFAVRWLDDALRMETAEPLKPDVWQHVAMTYDGSRTPEGVQIFVNGERQKLVTRLSALNQNFVSKEPLRIGSKGVEQKFVGGIHDVRLYGRVLEDDEARVIAAEGSVSEILKLTPASRTAAQTAKLEEFFLSEVADQSTRKLRASLRAARDQRRRFVDAIPTTMVMSEMKTPRPTHILARGSYEHPTEAVTAGTPAALCSASPQGNDRLALARWLVDPANPLPARVAVNREWQRFFGVGLVKTVEDFGAQGERPSHPELLDWMASEFVDGGWDIKALHRLIVTSATYRQSSFASKEAFAADPENRLLARGPRFRMTAEGLRDQALAIGGLLSEQIGGESVRPYQLDGLWASIASEGKYEQSHGGDLFRRSLYAFSKRTVGNPTLTLFDATTREACQVRRGRTNTPLQALALLNETTYVEAARGLAQQAVVLDVDATGRLRWMFRTATCREPNAPELDLLSRSLVKQSAHFQQSPDEAKKLIAIGESPVCTAVDSVTLAAWTAVASVILNLDEVVTRD